MKNKFNTLINSNVSVQKSPIVLQKNGIIRVRSFRCKKHSCKLK